SAGSSTWVGMLHRRICIYSGSGTFDDFSDDVPGGTQAFTPRNARCAVVDSRIGMRFSNQREFCSAGQRAAVGSDCSAPRFHAPDWLGIGRTTGRTFLRPDFVTRNLFPFRQVAISGRKLSHPGGDSGAFVMLSTWEQS